MIDHPTASLHHEEFARAVTTTADHHLPQFHVRLPRGYVNDPNGPIDIDGTTHLYFQSRPRLDLEIPVEWGHASSEDLVHWTLHRPAIVPVPGGADSGGAWSGNTVLHEGIVRAYYSGKVDDSPFQSVLMAESHDGGNTYGPPVQVVDDPSPDDGVTMFRDPFVWQDAEGWSMGVGCAAADQTASIRHYRSADGVRWEHIGDLVAMRRGTVNGTDTGEGWECPQVLTVDGVDVVIAASWSHARGPADVLAIPLVDGALPQKVDDGQHFYAASVMRTSSWGPVLFGWITEGRTAAWEEQAGWSGAISLPRRAWFRGGRFGSEPHPALESLRDGPSRPGQGAEVGAQAEVVVPVAASGRLRLRFSPVEYLDIDLDVEADTITIDRSHASVDDRARRDPVTAGSAFDSSADRSAVRVLLDGSIIEVFTSAGRSLTTRIYPTTPPPWAVETSIPSYAWRLESTMATAPASDLHPEQGAVLA